jgi:magnesium chelatase family protein
MTLANANETTHSPRIVALTGGRSAVVTTRSFRAPHHTISDVGVIGGGLVPRPREVSLTQNGILFLAGAPDGSHSSRRSLPLPSRYAELTSVFRSEQVPNRLILHAASGVPCC